MTQVHLYFNALVKQPASRAYGNLHQERNKEGERREREFLLFVALKNLGDLNV